jgi:hypothetical protein
MHFSGPIAAPERRLDLSPLLNRLRSRYLQRQIEALEAAEAARRQRVEDQRAIAAERRDADLGKGLPAEPLSAVPPQPSLEPDQKPEAAKPEARASPLTPSMLDPVPITDPDHGGVEIGADLPPPLDAPLQLTPQPAAPRRLRAPPPAVAPAEPIVPALEPPAPLPIYRTLPNGTIVKIR